jgi:hypothetical protein
MAKNEKCEISLDENKNISMDNIAEKRLSFKKLPNKIYVLSNQFLFEKNAF